MIARDEAPVIGAALESVRGFVDEIVVVDTGSTDGTPEIAKAHGAKVVHFTWNDSFAEARNVYLAHATADWILVLDADETLDPAAPAILRQCAATPRVDGRVPLFQLRERSHLDDGQDALHGAPLGFEHFILRFFPRRPELRYHGRIHEDLVHPGGEAAVERLACTALIHHHGYAAAEHARKDRSARNLPLLEQAVRDNPSDGFAHFNLGTHLFTHGDLPRALEHLQRSRSLDPAPGEGGRTVPYMASRFITAAEALRRLGRGDEAMLELQAAMRDFPAMPDAPFHLGNLLVERNALLEAENAYVHAIELAAAAVPAYFGLYDAGIGSWKARLQLAMTLGRQNRWQDALPWLLEADEAAPAVPLTLLALGLCRFHLEQYEEALAAWSGVDLEAVASADVLCRVAEAHILLGHGAEALATAEMAARRYPREADAVLCAARVHVEAGDGRGALRAYAAALTALEDVTGWLEYGEVAAEMGDLALAERAFQSAAALDEDRPECWNNLGALALNRGDYWAARDYLEKALRVNAGYDPAAWNLARVYILNGEELRALGFLRMRLKLGRYEIPDMIACWQAYRTGVMEDSAVRHDPVPGVLLAVTAAIHTGQTEDAVKWLEALEACGAAPEGVLPLRVEAERRRENLPEALMASVRWMEKCPDQLAAVQEAGQLLMELGRFEDATRLLDSVLDARA